MFRKNKLAMLVGEFLGTLSLTLMVIAISRQQYTFSPSLFIAATAGLVVVLMTLALGNISGAVFNPAMTIGLWTVRKLRTVQALSYIAVQLAGAAVAWEVFVYFAQVKGVSNNGHYNERILVAEIAGSFVFAFIWAAAVYQRFSLFAKAAAIGGALAAGSLIASLGSAGILNPAVALGVRQWAWGTYVLGPVLGAIIGFNLYNLLFVETELAEVAEAKAEKATVSAPAHAKTAKPAAAKKPVAVKSKATSAKPAAAKKKPVAKKTTARRSNPNAA